MPKDPMANDVKELSEKHKFDRIIVFGIIEGKPTQLIIHAKTDENREETKVVGDYLLGRFNRMFGMAHNGVKIRESEGANSDAD